MSRSALPESQKPHKAGQVICERCDLKCSGKWNCFPGAGNPVAKIMIVAEFPDQADDDAGQPVRGLGGAKLNFLLKQAGLQRDDVWITYAVKCRPGKGKMPIKRHLQACSVHLKEEIKWVKPKVVIPMGTLALKALAPDLGSIQQARGFPVPWKDKNTGTVLFYIVPVHSVKYAMAMVNSDAVLIRDLKMAKAVANGEWVPEPLKTKVRVCRTLDEVRGLAMRLQLEKSWSFDLENTGLYFTTDRILCFAFGFPGDEAAVVPYWKTFPVGGLEKQWTDEEREEILRILRPAFENDSDKTAHNGKYDLGFLRRHGIRVRNFNFDTMLAHHLIDVNKPHDLLFISQWYGLVQEQYDAYVEQQFRQMKKRDYEALDSTSLFQYAGIDAAKTQELRGILGELMERDGLIDVFRKVTMPLTLLLHDMEYNGARIDRKKLRELSELAGERIVGLNSKIQEITKAAKIETFNPNSPKHVLKFLLDCRALRPLREGENARDSGIKTTKTGNLSVDEEVLRKLDKAGRGRGLPGLIVSLREWTKLKGTYLDGKDGFGALMGQLDENHRIHTNFKIHGTISGRLSSADPNLQNIPKDAEFTTPEGTKEIISVRAVFIGDEDEDELMSVDYRQLEVRVAAALSRDPLLISEIQNGVDMHSRNAAAVLIGCTEEEFLKVRKDPTHPEHARYERARDAAKAVTFGVLYGSEAEGVSERNDVDLALAEKFIRGFFRKYSTLNAWIKGQHDMVRATGVVRTPTGRVVRFPVLKWALSAQCPRRESMRQVAEVERASVNLPIQSYGSDIFQSRKLRLGLEMRRNKMQSRFVLSLHDAFLANVKPHEKEQMIKLTKKLMPTVLNRGTKFEVPLDVDAKFSRAWGKS